ncbi:CCA tRNA nucleotidyltransferase [Chloroflexota bacterium]
MNLVMICAIMRLISQKKMSQIINLVSKIEQQLPAELVNFIRLAGDIAHKQKQNLYLVGGVVRDLLLEQTNLDLDLVIEGNAIELARQLRKLSPGKITTHPRFHTAKLQWDNFSIDLTTARSETYAKPGALPTVKPGSLSSDLFRRDFTINAMAINLNPGHYGELIDLHGGRDDLKHKLVRILHEKSFIDDATRIWRGLRYEQRLGFQLEPTTLKLLKQNIPMLDTISSDRIRYELECVLHEKYPEKVFRRAEELRVLPKLHPVLKGNGWLANKSEQSRQLSSPNMPSTGLYLALLVYRLTSYETEELLSYLRLPKSLAQTLRDTISIKSNIQSLVDPKLAPSSIYHLLHSYSSTAIIANSLASDSSVASNNLQLYLNKLRNVKPALNGNDLIKMGVPPGPQVKETLRRLHEARLDGKVTTKPGEKKLVNSWLADKHQPG